MGSRGYFWELFCSCDVFFASSSCFFSPSCGLQKMPNLTPELAIVSWDGEVKECWFLRTLWSKSITCETHTLPDLQKTLHLSHSYLSFLLVIAESQLCRISRLLSCLHAQGMKSHHWHFLLSVIRTIIKQCIQWELGSDNLTEGKGIQRCVCMAES